ncbi:hypothetical protein AB205_0102730, partial [Aquarana catesbeiana]
MDLQNQSLVTEFTLSGLSHSRNAQVIFFVLFLALYLMTLSGNLLIMTAVHVDPHLRSPMYFFLSNLSFLDICYSTVTIPKMLLLCGAIVLLPWNHNHNLKDPFFRRET